MKKHKRVKRSVKSGLPPGSLVYVGKQSDARAEISLISYNNVSVMAKDCTEVVLPTKLDNSQVHWLNINGFSDVELLKKIGEEYGLHILTLEDILNTEQRAKIEEYNNYFYLVMKMISYDNTTDEIQNEQLSLIVKDNLLITFQERSGDIFSSLRERISTPESRVRKKEVDYLLYAILDIIVDHYFIVLEKIGDQIELLEEEILNNASELAMQRLYKLKREVISLRRSIWPLREVVSFIERGESGIIKPETKIYLRDLYDHTIQVIEGIENLREIVTGLVDIYLSSVSNRMNSVMKVLTIIATIFIPLTFIAGVYGMNFANMPELNWRFGYPIILLLMFIIGGVMLYFFKKKRWL